MPVVCLLLCCNLHAQFKNKASLGPVTKTGFYAITVTPELSSYVKTDFSDLRIKDDSGRQAPYIIRALSSMYYDTVFTKFKIVNNRLADSGKNIIILENAGKERNISTIALLIRNNLASRIIDISGGDNAKEWYSIVENGTLGRRFITQTDKYLAAIDLPNSSFRYFKLVIYNGNKDPLNILSAGSYFDAQYKYITPYVLNGNSRFVQKDSSDQYSYIKVHDSMMYHKNYLHIHFKTPLFFKRSVEVLVNGRILSSFNVTVDSGFNTSIPLFNAGEWTLRIFNGDSPPLRVESISTYQTKNKIVTWLDSGVVYHLEMNNDIAIAPVFDLQEFKDSIPLKVEEISVGAIESMEASVVATSKSFFTKAWLWPVMMVVLLVLIVFTWRLTKEMGKSNQ